MDYDTALALKTNISGEIIGSPKKRTARIFSVYSSGPAYRFIRLSRELRSGVNGVGIGLMNGQQGYHLKILTRSQGFSPLAIASYYNLRPEQLSLRQAGPIRFLSNLSRHRPPVAGISVGHYQVSAGTLGCILKRLNDEAYYILSNNHVLANVNQCSVGDPVFQPAKLDGGQSADIIARLTDFEPLLFDGANLFDAAIARLEVLPEQLHIPGIGAVSAITEPVVNARVQKMGRTTELTAGQIVSRSTDIEVDFGNGRKLVFRNQFEIEGRDGQDELAGFSTGGDSGSLVVETRTNKAVGLLFAGDDSGSSYASPLAPIFSRFNVFLS